MLRAQHLTALARQFVAICPVVWLRILFNDELGKINEPGFGNAGHSIAREFLITIVIDRRISHLNHEEHIGSKRMRLGIEIITWLQHSKIRLWLGIVFN